MSQPTNISPEPQQAAPSTENQTVSLSKSNLVSICAVGLLISFFLPWIRFLGSASGFDLAKLGGKALILWSIPIFCIITLFAAVSKSSVKSVAQLTGALPFFALGYGLYNAGSDLMQVLAVGGYMSLGLGLALFILPRQDK